MIDAYGWQSFPDSCPNGLIIDLAQLRLNKVAQELLRHDHSRITLSIYTQAASMEMAPANGRATDTLLPATLSTLTAPSGREGETVSC